MKLLFCVVFLLLVVHLTVGFKLGPKVPRVTQLTSLQEPAAIPVEQTYIMIKPDGVQRMLIGLIISRFEAKGYVLRALKMITPSKEMLEEHYQDLKDEPFFGKLMSFMSSGPIVGMVWEGKNIVQAGRAMLGATNPLNSAPGTIRGDLAICTGRNVCHGSDSVESAKREIALWFPEGLHDYYSHNSDWINE